MLQLTSTVFLSVPCSTMITGKNYLFYMQLQFIVFLTKLATILNKLKISSKSSNWYSSNHMSSTTHSHCVFLQLDNYFLTVL